MKEVIEEIGQNFMAATAAGDDVKASAYSRAITVLKKHEKKRKRKEAKKARRNNR